MWAEGCAGGCAIALPRGRAGGGRRRGAAVGSRRVPWGPSMWAEGRAIALTRGWAGRGCAGGVCYSPAEGVCQRGCRCWEPPHALGGLLCGRRDAPEGCAIVLPRGCAGGARPEGCRC